MFRHQGWKEAGGWKLQRLLTLGAILSRILSLAGNSHAFGPLCMFHCVPCHFYFAIGGRIPSGTYAYRRPGDFTLMEFGCAPITRIEGVVMVYRKYIRNVQRTLTRKHGADHLDTTQ
jgi:hypothetical protein